MSAQIISSKWEGHKAPVSCLDYSGDFLLSGSEDRTARLWDVRDTKRRAAWCVSAPGEVFSVKFAPKLSTEAMEMECSNPFAIDHIIYLSMEHVVLEYDLRKATGPILSTPTRDLSPILQNQEEVNQIAATYWKPQRKGKSIQGDPELYIATADDAGTIRFMESTSTKSHILHHDPTGVAVVTSCAFRPGSSKALEFVSGGTDCKIQMWDMMKPKRPIATYTIQQPESGDTNKPQVCNPPMVYSLAWSPSGKLLVAGLGDGNIPLFAINNRTLVQTGHLQDGHDSSVASVLFPAFGKTNERMVVSGGSDGSVICWDIGTNVMEVSETYNPKDLFAETFIAGTSDDEPMEGLSHQTETLSLGKSTILFGISHNKKVNWMTTSEGAIFVADTSHAISEYKLPIR